MIRPELLLLLLLAWVAGPAVAQDEQQARTVIGPSNIDLADGAEALLSGDAEKGVELTQRGLKSASNDRERVAGLSNLCAGLVMLQRHAEALEACDRALAIDDNHWRAYCNRALANLRLSRFDAAARDISRAEAISPNARSVKRVKSMVLDATDPVRPSITIDDRRSTGNGDE